MRVPVIILSVSVSMLAANAVRAQDGPSYVKDVRPFLDKFCVECHQSGNAKAGVNLASFDAIMKGGKKGRRLLTAGDPDQSRIVLCTEGISGKKMPPKKAKQPTKNEIEVLRNWIKAGAKDDTGAQKKDAPSNEKTQSSNHGGHAESAGVTPFVMVRDYRFDFPVPPVVRLL
jgi:Planctomycete cytochrome C